MASGKPIRAARSLSCISALLFLFIAIASHGVHVIGFIDVAGAFLTCKELPAEVCASSVSFTSNRCVLAKTLMLDGTLQFQCQLSVVAAENLVEWIERKECIKACGLERMAAGMSTASLLELEFSRTLCSSECRKKCPVIFHLFVNLAAGGGLSVLRMCEYQKTRSRLLFVESLSSSSKPKSNVRDLHSPVAASAAARPFRCPPAAPECPRNTPSRGCCPKY